MDQPPKSPVGSFNDVLISDVLKRNRESVEDFEHLDPDRTRVADDFDPVPVSKTDVTPPGMADVKASTIDFLADLTSSSSDPLKSSQDLFSSAFKEPNFENDDTFSFNKPLPPEPLNVTHDFLMSESVEIDPIKMPTKTEENEIKLLSDFEESKTPEPIVEPSIVEVQPSSVRDSPPPVPKHQSLLDDSPNEDDFEPSQTPEPDYEPPQKVPIESAPAPAKEETPSPKPVKEDSVSSRVPETDIPKKEKGVTTIGADIGARDLFTKLGLDTWFDPGRLHPKVEALVYWRDVKKSGVVFGVTMISLLSLVYCSLISVVSYLCLIVLFSTISFRIYRNIMQAVQKTSDGHPFKHLLEIDVEISEERVRKGAEVGVKHLNACLLELRRLFLVVDLVDSLKFGVCLWVMTYIGALFNGLTLVIIGVVALFALPKVYENNKQQIDAYIELASGKVSEITNKVKAALPVGKKEAEKPKDQ